MDLAFYSLSLFFFWTIFGSFSSVLIERWNSGKWGIMTGRSECPKCHKQLWFLELFPILSYIAQGWKCKGCKTKIPSFYPLLELSMGMIFVAVWYWLLGLGYTWEDPAFWFMLLCAWITGIYISYDLRFTEIPDQALVPGIYLCLILIVGGYYMDVFRIFPDIHTYLTYHTFATDHIYWAIILYSFFYFQILIPGGLFLIQKRDFKNLAWLLLSYFSLPIQALLDLFQKKKKDDDEIDIPTWIGWGDLRIALFIWLTLGTLHGIASFAFAYIIWSIIGVWVLLLSYYRVIPKKKEIAFWPFLGLGWILSIIFYNEIFDIIGIIL